MIEAILAALAAIGRAISAVTESMRDKRLVNAGRQEAAMEEADAREKQQKAAMETMPALGAPEHLADSVRRKGA